MPSTIPVSSNARNTGSNGPPDAIMDGASSLGYSALASMGRISPTGCPSPAARWISFAARAGSCTGSRAAPYSRPRSSPHQSTRKSL